MGKQLTDESKISIAQVEEFILNAPQVEIPLVHKFCDGMYYREITVPPNTFILGHKHTHSCFNILSKGSMLIKESMEDPGRLIEAPCSFVTNPGVQKMAQTIDECVYVNVFRTDETDVEKLEEMLIEKSEVFLEYEKKQKLIEGEKKCQS